MSEAVPRPRFPWLGYALALAVIVLVAFAPFLAVYIASVVADANGCVVDALGPHECRVGGGDQGPLLYALGASGWYFLATMPLAGIALFGWIVMLVTHRLRWGSRTRMVREK